MDDFTYPPLTIGTHLLHEDGTEHKIEDFWVDEDGLVQLHVREISTFHKVSLALTDIQGALRKGIVRCPDYTPQS